MTMKNGLIRFNFTSIDRYGFYKIEIGLVYAVYFEQLNNKVKDDRFFEVKPSKGGFILKSVNDKRPFMVYCAHKNRSLITDSFFA
jgi:rhodanese-related sulfurtransferase